MHDCTFGMCSTCIHICSLCTSVATLLPSITRLQLASKFPTSSIMDQGMFWLLVLEHLSKQASNRLACPGACPSTRNGDPDDMDGVLRQCRAAQILISGAVFELVSLSQPVTLGNWWWVEKAAQQRERKNSQACPHSAGRCRCLYHSSKSSERESKSERRRGRRASPLY